MKDFSLISSSRRLVTILAFSPVLLAGCTTLETALRPVPPTAQIEQVRLTALSFAEAELTADIRINNPNPLGVRFSEFSYQLDVAGSPLVSGVQPEGLEIAANGSALVSFPISLVFSEAREVVQRTTNSQDVAYRVAVSAVVDVPVLGPITIPLEQDGTVPVPQIPQVQLSRLQVDELSLAGATVSAVFVVDNPNSFGVAVDSLSYDLEVQGLPWASGRVSRSVALNGQAQTQIPVSFSLRFLEIGRSVYRLLTGEDTVEYTVTGSTVIRPDHPLLATREFPLDRSGSVEVLR